MTMPPLPALRATLSRKGRGNINSHYMSCFFTSKPSAW